MIPKWLLNKPFSPLLKYLYSPLSCYWCTGPPLILQRQKPTNAVVNQSVETHLLSSWERTGASHLDFTRRSVHAYKTARLPRCSPHTRLWAFHGGDLSSSPPLPLLQFVKSRLSFVSMAVRGVVCIQQRNS